MTNSSTLGMKMLAHGLAAALADEVSEIIERRMKALFESTVEITDATITLFRKEANAEVSELANIGTLADRHVVPRSGGATHNYILCFISFYI